MNLEQKTSNCDARRVRRRWKILLLTTFGLIALLSWFAIATIPAAVTLRDGTTLTIISTSYGNSFFFAPHANPIKRAWQEVWMHLPYVRKPINRFYSVAGAKDALIWFKHDAVEKGPYWSPPWQVIKEDGSPRGYYPEITGFTFQRNVHGTAGVVWKDCPTNLPTLTLAFYKENTNTILWDKYTEQTFLGRITIPNPAYHR